VGAQALIARGEDMKGALVRGIDPALEPQVTDLAADLATDRAAAPGAGRVRRRCWAASWRAAWAWARRHGHADRAQRPGHAGRRGAAHAQMTVVGTFDSGHYEYDSALALLHRTTRRASSASRGRPACA
jgi:lipoprotein-releasing system permease protein